MGTTQHSQQTAPVAIPPTKNAVPSLFWSLIVSNLVLSFLSIANLGLISSTIAWQLDQKHNVHSYTIAWPQTTFDLDVEPARLWVEQVYASIAAAACGVLLGLFGIYVAWTIRKGARPLRSIPTLLILHLLATVFTLSALIFVFVITYRTTNQSIRAPIAANTQGYKYDEFTWTPETWFTAVLDLPLADQHMHDEIDSKLTAMMTWRWMLVPIFIVDIIACGVTTLAWLKQRKGATTRAGSANTIEK